MLVAALAATRSLAQIIAHRRAMTRASPAKRGIDPAIGLPEKTASMMSAMRTPWAM